MVPGLRTALTPHRIVRIIDNQTEKKVFWKDMYSNKNLYRSRK